MTDTIVSSGAASTAAAEDGNGGRAAAWLQAAARPGATAMRAATLWRVASAVLAIAQWAGVAFFAQAMILSEGASPLLGLGIAAAAGLLSAIADDRSRQATARAAARIGETSRRRLIRGSLPSSSAAARREPATTAESALGLIDQVADHLSTQAPLRRSASVIMIAIFALTVIVHWPAAIILALATAMLPANMWLAGRLAQDGNDRYLHALERLGAVVLDSFRGLGTLQRLGAVDVRRRTIDRASQRLQQANLAVLQRAFVSGAVMDVVVTMSIAVSATYVGMTLLGYVSVPGTAPLDLGHGLFVLLLCPMYFTPLRQAASGFHDRERALASARTISAVADGDEDEDRPAETAAPVDVPVRVVVDGLRVGADEDGRPLLRTATRLVAEEGTWTAVVGPSGAGKTTLLTAIAGQRPDASGTVDWQLPDGSTRTPWVGGASWIGQQTVLLSGSLADNLRLGAPEADDAALLEALDKVGLRPLLLRLPDGLLTACGPRGYRFSAGEARRIAVARAMLRGARLWLLDEPTAHLDADTELVVRDALIAATQGCTVIVVTHSAAIASVAESRWHVEDGTARMDPVTKTAISSSAPGEER